TALGEVLGRVDVIAVGPGLGRSAWAVAALNAVLKSGKPLVVDADALNLLAEHGAPAREDWILTPHPGEAGRLLGVSAEDIQRDRLAALDRLIERFHGTIVLKGAGTLVGARGRTPGVCERGNPGMATAGSGDVLTGAIAGSLAQCRDHWTAARVGALMHAMAGDAAARGGARRSLWRAGPRRARCARTAGVGVRRTPLAHRMAGARRIATAARGSHARVVGVRCRARHRSERGFPAREVVARVAELKSRPQRRRLSKR